MLAQLRVHTITSVGGGPCGAAENKRGFFGRSSDGSDAGINGCPCDVKLTGCPCGATGTSGCAAPPCNPELDAAAMKCNTTTDGDEIESVEHDLEPKC